MDSFTSTLNSNVCDAITIVFVQDARVYRSCLVAFGYFHHEFSLQETTSSQRIVAPGSGSGPKLTWKGRPASPAWVVA